MGGIGKAKCKLGIGAVRARGASEHRGCAAKRDKVSRI